MEQCSERVSPFSNDLNIDMNELVDVITLFKCKFCDVSFERPNDIRQHMQDVHVVREERTSETKSVSTEVFQDNNIQPEENITSIEGTMSYCFQDAQVEAIGQQDIEIRLEKGTSENETQNIPIFDNIPQTESKNGMHSGKYSQVNLLETSSINRELSEVYLCGQCNMGFETMESCKDHIVKDHYVATEQETDKLEEQNRNNNSVENHEERIIVPTKYKSVGTQAILLKKTGRKKKTVNVTEELQPDAEVYGEEEAEVIREHRQNEIEEQEENANLAEGKIRRKRKLPQRLTQLYYVGKPAPVNVNSISPLKRKPRVAESKIKCSYSNCSIRFSSQSSLEIHLECHKTFEENGKQIEGFMCYLCSYFSPHWKFMRLHLWKEHSLDTGLHKCEDCEFRADTMYQIEKHAQIHCDARSFVCDQCGKSFKTASQFNSHVANHLSKKSKSSKKTGSELECDICQKMFANERCLKNHYVLHSKVKPFACHFCNYTCARKAVLEMHLRTHTGEKPFKCDMCMYMTGDHNSLRRHRMRHTGEKPYKCQYCKYSAIQAIALKSHIKTKHPGCEGVFACQSCSYRTINETNFKNHMLDHKNGFVVAKTEDKKQMNESNNDHKTDEGNDRILLSALTSGATLVHHEGSDENHQFFTISGQPVTAIQIPSEEVIQESSNTEVQCSTNPQLITKLTNVSMMQGDSNTAKLIYTALGALGSRGAVTQQNIQGISINELSNIQDIEQDGVTTHTITFHIPPDGLVQGEDQLHQSHEQQIEHFSGTDGDNRNIIINETLNENTTGERPMILALQSHEYTTRQTPLSIRQTEDSATGTAVSKTVDYMDLRPVDPTKSQSNQDKTLVMDIVGVDNTGTIQNTTQ